MSKEHVDYRFNGLFDHRKSIDSLLGKSIYTKKNGDFVFRLFVFSLEEFIVVSLKHKMLNEEIFSFSMKNINAIKEEDKTLLFYQNNEETPLFIANLGHCFSFKNNMIKTMSTHEGTIDGFEEYELLELFDDADLQDEARGLRCFYSFYNEKDLVFTFVIDSAAKKVRISFKDHVRNHEVFCFIFYNISTIRVDKNTVEIFQKNKSNRSVAIILKPQIMIIGDINLR